MQVKNNKLQKKSLVTENPDALVKWHLTIADNYGKKGTYLKKLLVEKTIQNIVMKGLLHSCIQQNTLPLLYSMVNKCLHLQKTKKFLFLLLPWLAHTI